MPRAGAWRGAAGRRRGDSASVGGDDRAWRPAAALPQDTATPKSDPFDGEGYCASFSLPHCHHHGPQRDDPYPDEGAELLQHQIWSVSSLPPDEQAVSGLVPGVLDAGSSLSSVQAGTWCFLQKRARLDSFVRPTHLLSARCHGH